MKKLKCIIYITLILICFFVTKTYAINTTTSSANIMISGSTSIKNGENGKFTISINSDKNIGTVSGTISKSNISNLNIKGINGWNVVYNEAAGKFNMLKAEGGKSEEIAEITFSVDENAKENVWIKLDDKINLVTTDYQKIQETGIKKTISINSELPPPTDLPVENAEFKNIVVTRGPDKTSYIVGEKFDKTGMVIIAEYSNNMKKDITNYVVTTDTALTLNDKEVVIKYTENDVTKETKIPISVSEKIQIPVQETDSTPSKDSIPQTGTRGIISVLLILSIVIMYVNFKKFKGM